MSWKSIQLSDLAMATGGSFVDGPFGSNMKASEYEAEGVPIIRLQNVRPNEFLTKDIKFVSPRKAAELSRHNYAPGDLVISKLGDPPGYACVVPPSAGSGIIVADVVRFRGDPKLIDHRYVSFYLNSPAARQQFLNLSKGTTRTRVNLSSIKTIEIPLPPTLDEQRRIAAMLNNADSLRRQRQESLRLTGKLLQSVFIAMFGDPVRNSKNLPTADLSDLAKLERGKFTPRPRNDPSYFGGPYPFIQTGDITRSKGRITSWNQTLNEKGARVSKEFGRGTVVIAIVGATLGETAIVETPVFCPDSIIGITPFPERATPEFIEFLLRLWKPRLKELAPDAARANLNLERLRPLVALAPDIEEQKKFSRIATRLRELALTKLENQHQLDQLFSSLQQRAFRGELDLSKLVLTDVAETDNARDWTHWTAAEPFLEHPARPRNFIAPPEIEARLVELESTLDDADVPVPWSEEYFKYRTLSQLAPPFNFEKVWDEAHYAMPDANYETVKERVFEYIEGGILEQQFDETRKEIVFYPCA